ncbi:MAG: hypothetical protein H7Y88_09415 [Phycisphaerales bacterium]|nr:hypothetical protein [Phycisphaerales bacterium]
MPQNQWERDKGTNPGQPGKQNEGVPAPGHQKNTDAQREGEQPEDWPGSAPQSRQGQGGTQQHQQESVSGIPGRGQEGANQDEPMSDSETDRLSGRNANAREDGNDAGRGMGRDTNL